MKNTCRKCGEKVKQTYRVVVAPKCDAEFCQNCCNAWFDLRDKLVADAFRDYVSVSKSK